MTGGGEIVRTTGRDVAARKSCNYGGVSTFYFYGNPKKEDGRLLQTAVHDFK
jgi:hypothetical protein